MNYNDHSRLKGTHALLSPSSPSWLNYKDEELNDKLFSRYRSKYLTDIGTILHEYAADCIELNTKIGNNKSEKNSIMRYLYKRGIPLNIIDVNSIFDNLAAYVNDAIGFKMDPEVVLYYSPECYGTADAFSFRKNQLRIHDLKTGTTPVHMEQLLIYAALYFLEYGANPAEIETELRIYQNNEVTIMNPTSEDILPVMNRIIISSEYVSRMKGEE